MKTTWQLADECFGIACEIISWKVLARAARKFVRKENWQKSFDKSICRKCSEKRKHSICGTMRDVIQCSYFKTACRKTTGKGK
jgi:hypothetical protein